MGRWKTRWKNEVIAEQARGPNLSHRRRNWSMLLYKKMSHATFINKTFVYSSKQESSTVQLITVSMKHNAHSFSSMHSNTPLSELTYTDQLNIWSIIPWTLPSWRWYIPNCIVQMTTIRSHFIT
jgi:hypothetical protein